MVHSSSGVGQSLHSRYNPVGEAEKYINSLALRQHIRFFILIEPGRGYMIPVLHRKFPQAQILALHLEAVPEEEQSKGIPSHVWYPGSGLSLQQFLEHEIPDTDAAAIGIIEWRPALAVYGEGYLWLLSETADFIKRIDANKRTIRVFGLRWFKNFFKNMGIIRRLALVPKSLPWIITGAGPSLEQSIPLIRDLKRKNQLLLLAASSSVQALLVRDLLPDMIIATDGGGWALPHLYECLRGLDTKPPFILAASLWAALPSQCADLPLLPLSEGNLWQTLILQELKIPFISLIQRGTVTASALDLAFTITRGNVFIAGIDLSHQDIRTHARPYSFERFMEAAASRFNPVYSQTFVRSFGIIEGGSHTIYAAWFGKHLGDYPKRLYSLGNNHPIFKDLKSWEDGGLTSTGSAETFGFREVHSQGNLAKQGVAILLQALVAPQTSSRIKQELGSLLFPDEADITLERLRDAILTITSPYCRGTRYG
jgi:hypothetical protein